MMQFPRRQEQVSQDSEGPAGNIRRQQCRRASGGGGNTMPRPQQQTAHHRPIRLRSTGRRRTPRRRRRQSPEQSTRSASWVWSIRRTSTRIYRVPKRSQQRRQDTRTCLRPCAAASYVDFFFTKVISLPVSLNSTSSMNVRISNNPRPLILPMFSGSVGSGSELGSKPGPSSHILMIAIS